MSLTTRIVVWIWIQMSLIFLHASNLAPGKSLAKRLANAGVFCIKRATVAGLGHRKAKWLGVDEL